MCIIAIQTTSKPSGYVEGEGIEVERCWRCGGVDVDGGDLEVERS